MTRVDFIKKVAKDTGAPYCQAEQWVNAVLDSLGDALVTEDEVRLRGFGQFEHKRRKAKVGRNAVTGEPIPIPPKTIVHFEPSRQIASDVRDIPVPEAE